MIPHLSFSRRGIWLAAAFACIAAPAALILGSHMGAKPHEAAHAPPSTALRVAIPREYRALVALTATADTVGQDSEAARGENDALPFAKGAVLSASPFRALTAAGADHDRALQCLTQAVYYEAGFEPEGGRRAVAQVVLNRVRHPAFAKSVCGVVYQGSNAPGCQFSFTCDGALARRPEAHAWAEARRIAADALAGKVYAPVGTATHYHADYVFPRWAPYLAKLTQIGAHIFYRWPGGWGLPGAFRARYAGGEAIPAFDPARFATTPEPQIVYPAVAALPERRADNDLGGRMDPTKGWTLAIPDPSETHGAFRAMESRQEAPVPARTAATPMTRLASARPASQEEPQ